MRLWVLTVDIYEASVGRAYPVVQHNFFGETQEEALGYYEAHLTTDAFLRGCVERQRWKQIECSTQSYWRRE